jgi:pimeloyl-ACP methyl ester carboxylesterase
MVRVAFESMDFALVHGSFHGGWCWDLVRPELERLGHSVIAVDLPISTPGLGSADYARAVEEALEGCDEPILVGHSMAGLVIPIVAARRPVKQMVFLAAFLPVPGKSAVDQRAAEPIDSRVPPTTAEWTDMGDDVWMVGPNTATELFLYDVSTETATWAIERLRPQCYRFMSEVTPLQEWPDVESRSIVCAEDRAINPDWVRSAARERLGVEAIEIGGGHSPFLSRPTELAELLNSLG